MREEEQAYNSQAIVLPLRRLAASASTEAEHDALVGGPGINVPTPAAPSLEASQQHAKEGREAQQNALKEQTGDTLYPSSGEAQLNAYCHRHVPFATGALKGCYASKYMNCWR